MKSKTISKRTPRARILGRWGLFGALALPLTALADPAMLFILDASGSMWGRVGGMPKISSAKSVLRELVGQTPERIQVGLMAYGHRKKGDCTDIELIALPGGERAAMQRRIDAVNPKGRTPISASLEQASGVLVGREDETTLVLISDGLETCGGDPCATAQRLREQGLKVVIHVVGFDVDAKATGQLQCIAEAGGGRYFAADDAAALRDALGRVQASVVEAKPLPAPPSPPKVPAEKPQSKRIRIAGPGRVRLKPAAWVKMAPYYWQLQEVESSAVKGRNNKEEVRVKAGEYQIVWRQSEHGHSEVPLTEVVTVRSGKTTEVPLDTGLRITVPEGVKPPYWWGLVEPGGTDPLFRFHHTLEPQLVPAGDYRLLWYQVEHGSKITDLGPVRIEPGSLNDLVLDHGILLQPAPWLGNPKPYFYRLLDGNGEIAGSWSTMGPQLAAPGDYTLVYRPTEHRHRGIRWGKVRVPEHGLAMVPLNSGVIFLHESKAKPPYGIYFVNLESGDEVAMGNTWAPLPLPPGRYRMDWWEVQHGSNRETLVDSLQIEQGTVLELEL